MTFTLGAWVLKDQEAWREPYPIGRGIIKLWQFAPAITGAAVVRILPLKVLHQGGVVRKPLLALGGMVRVLEHSDTFVFRVILACRFAGVLRRRFLGQSATRFYWASSSEKPCRFLRVYDNVCARFYDTILQPFSANQIAVSISSARASSFVAFVIVMVKG